MTSSRTATEQKLIVVSSRLPVKLSHENHRWRVEPSPGGLATALRSVAEQRPFLWIGWPGAPVPQADQDIVARKLAAHRVPVFLSRAQYHGFYEEFSNRLLWPLFHNVGERSEGAERTAWQRYREVNERFADAVAEVAQPGDLVWVHDYQLALVPNLLRERKIDCGIGYFLHVPFPSAEAYRTLPMREEILRGVLGADLIGFHTYEYLSHFRNSCVRVLGLDTEPETIVLPTRSAHLGVHPIGIDPLEILRFAATSEVQGELEVLRRRFAGKKVVVGVDRLDYTKGIPQKLLAFQEFLRRHPRWRGRCVLVQVAPLSRTEVKEYQELKRHVDELVGQINGRYGSFDHTPILYINQNLSRARLTALYQAADVALITPLRDGMNLVALEYIAARGEQPGSLVLSEFAGAASFLSGARLVNPYNVSEITEVLAHALNESEAQDKGFRQMIDFVSTNTSSVWAERFVSRLEKAHREEHGTTVKRLAFESFADPQEILDQGPLFILDYEGTLQAAPSDPLAPGPRLRDTLAELASRAAVYVVSHQSAETLDDWFDDPAVGLVCEDGLAIKEPGGAWPDSSAFDRTVLDNTVRQVFEDFVERTPGSTIEEKSASLAWHYRTVDPKLGKWRGMELYALLDDRLRGLPFAVLVGSKRIEVRHADMTKAQAVRRILARHDDCEFVFCAANDRMDEEMFEVVQRSDRQVALTCYVGRRAGWARLFVESPQELTEQLERLAAAWEGKSARLPAASAG